MRNVILTCIVLALTSACSPADSPFGTFNHDPDKARIITEDLDRFWAAWDLAAEHPERRREIFLEHYLQAGSPGLEKFVELRIGDVDQLLAAIDAHPDYYASLRRHSPQARAAAEPVREALHELQRVYPDAVFPDTYIVIGRMNSGGTLDHIGLLIGFEMYGMAPDAPLDELGEWHRSVIGSVDSLPAIIMHELIHYQQAVNGNLGFDNLLGISLSEGAADFLTELLMGAHINRHIHEWALPREAELWAEFREVMHASDTTGWLYGGAQVRGRPADLGYFMGYRIAESYYERADDKQAAIADIIGMTDPVAFLKASGYPEGRFNAP